ncbi:hypothetical protein QYE76_033361 [Lolium multiflorum]|uniref:Aminotransferase-like plant mobile domain-containing protein n=1 Tax=Lolium multiflorum TaxID=4521 RepID=A0AAD8QYY4_LOLMU|nr:hypothetical protein QYE76_033361 [Lolium multiflorum]
MPMWLPSCRRHTPSRRGAIDAELVRPSDVAACVAPLPSAPHMPTYIKFSETSRGSGRLGLSRFARLYVWRRCHGRHTSMCGADATGATHPLKCGARAPSPTQPVLLFFLLSSHGTAAARLPFAPHQIEQEIVRSVRPTPSSSIPQGMVCLTKFICVMMVWLLDEEYDREHRAVHMTERETDLHPLKIRYHGTSDIPYDERYTEFIRPTGLMPFISLVSRGGPHMNPSALTALVDRWRPETHTFHLRAGEMAPTLQDVSMILALPIQGEPPCMNTASGWRQQMANLIGMAPPAPENPKQRVPAGASFEWIRTNFGECPIEADEDTRRTYARVYLWYMISRTLFPDSGGKLAHWCWLKALTVLDDRWSWGTAALAYLYRQLDEACRRTGSKTGSGGIGGCMLLLSVWSWDRLSVGRPRALKETPWPHHPHFPDREPTWAYLWDNVSEMTSDPMVMYSSTLRSWTLLPLSRWNGSHMPQRVMRQFGLYQECPPMWQDTDKALHRLDRQRQRKITNWPVHHRGHIAAFQHCLEAARNAGPEQIVPHDFTAFNKYLEWFHQNTRIELVKRAYREEILDDPIQFDEVGKSQHDTFARRGRSTSIASELNFVREEIQKTADECEIMWDQSHRDEKPVGPLRNFIKNTARKMRRLANLLGCREGEIPTSSSSEEQIPPEDDLILSQGILPKHTSKQAPRSAYQFKPRGKAPNRYTPEDYVNRGKKVVTEEDDGPPRRSALSKMRNDEPFSSDEEEEEEQEEQEEEQEQEQQQQQPRQRTKRMAVRKQPARTAR